MNKINLNNLQIGNTDLVGNKFNGHNLHMYLREKGIESHQLVWEKESNDEYTYEIALDKPNRYSLKSDLSNLQGLYGLNNILSPFSYDILYNKLFLESDVVHYHLIHELNFDIQLFPLLTKLKPTVWSLHDPWAVGGHCVHHFDCNKWKSHCYDCPYLNKPYHMNKDNSALNFELKKQAILQSDLDIIVSSKWMKNIVQKSPIFKGKKIHLVPIGIDQEIFKPIDKEFAKRRFGIPANAITLLFRCDYSGFKGMDYIEYVLKNLKTDRQIYIITLKEKLKKRYPLYKYVEFDWIKEDKILSTVYNASDLLLMPSAVESFGMMAVEAMCCGTTPIVLEGTSLPEVVKSNSCGVSTQRNYAQYLQAVEYYISNNKARKARNNKCLIFSKKRYSKEKYLSSVISIYSKVINRHKIKSDSKLLIQQLKKHMLINTEEYQRKKFRNQLLKFRYKLFVKLFWFKDYFLQKFKLR